jgi:hypothetical protein
MLITVFLNKAWTAVRCMQQRSAAVYPMPLFRKTVVEVRTEVAICNLNSGMLHW